MQMEKLRVNSIENIIAISWPTLHAMRDTFCTRRRHISDNLLRINEQN